MSAEGDKSILPGKHHRGVGYIRGDGPEGPGVYEITWAFTIDIEGFVSLEHKARKIKTHGA